MNKIVANEEIYGYSVIVIDENGTNRGEVIKRLAISLAKEKGFDLIQVGKSDKGLSICKYGDLGKLKYEASKKSHAQKPVKTKEMMFALNEAQHDIDIKKSKVKTMLEKKCIVKFGVELKGRQRSFMEAAKQLLQQSVADLRDVAKWDDLKVVDREVFVVLKPLKEAIHVESKDRPAG